MMRALATPVALAILLAACGQAGEGNTAAAANDGNAAAASPSSSDNLAAVLGKDQRFAALIDAAGMRQVLEGKAPYTVLAPTPQALDALPAGTLDRLQKPKGKAELTALLRRHILPGTVLAADLGKAVDIGKGKATLATMAGDPLTVTKDGNALKIGDAKVVGAEQTASNGVVHQIDAVLPVPSAG